METRSSARGVAVQASAAVWEHLFVLTSQGSLHGQLQRARDRGNFLQADALARDLAPLPLGDALRLLELIRVHQPDRFERAAVRWHARFALTVSGLTLPDSRLALVLLDAHRHDALPALLDLCRRYRVPNTPRRPS